MENIGAIIRNHRIAKCLTQEELGNKVFVSKQAVSKWETGRTLPDIETIRKLCDVLEISKDEILGGSIEQSKKSRKWSRLCIVITVISLISALFFGLGGFDYIDRHTQAGVAYLSVFWNGELLITDRYSITSDLNFKDLQNGYKADLDYGEIRGTLNIYDTYNVEFGFANTNNWHNVHLRLDLEERSGQVTVRQTLCYETDNNTYQVLVTEKTASGRKLSVFREGV